MVRIHQYNTPKYLFYSPKTKEKEHSRSVLFSFCKLDKNFFDATKYAGEGNIGHIMMHVAMHKQELLKQVLNDHSFALIHF